MPLPTADDLERRKNVRVRLRPNLAFVRQANGGEFCYILQDPVSMRYFRLEEKQRFVAQHLDGTKTLEEIRKAYEQHFRPNRLSLPELESFAAQLLDSGLAQNESPQAGQLLYERAEKHRRQALRARLLSFLYIKIPLCHPDHLLSRLLPWLGWLFTPRCAIASFTVMLAALGLLATHWTEFLARLPATHDLLGLQNVLYLWLALGVVKVLHELGHGLSCKAFGGQVPEMGLLLLIFFPCLYCDVSDSWRIESRWRRIVVSAAGIYVELLIAALATFAWWLTDPSTLLHHVCLALMIVCSLNTILLNANPLMRFDGYYILSDWLGVPNLAETSGRVVSSACLRWLGIPTAAETAVASRWRTLLAVYAVASYVYRWVALACSFYLIYSMLQPYKLGSLGYALTALGVLAMLVLPVQRLLRAVQRQGGLPDMKPARVLLSAAGLVALVVVVWAVPFPRSVQGMALVQVDPDELQRVVVPQAGGSLQIVPVRDGQRVKSGEVLAVLANPELEIKLRVNEADQALRHQQKSAYLAELTDIGHADAQTAAGLQQSEAGLQALLREHALLREQRDRLTLRAPCDGIVAGLPSAEAKGKWLEPGSELCHVANDAILRAALLIGPADHELVAQGSRAWLHVHGSGLHSTAGVVREIALVDARSIPPQLSSRVGGEVATQPDAASGTEKPYQPHYLVAIRLPRRDAATHPGAMGRARIEGAPQTLWWHFRRAMATTFNWGL
jgi:putative peptide zinc metalloprotease protein